MVNRLLYFKALPTKRKLVERPQNKPKFRSSGNRFVQDYVKAARVKRLSKFWKGGKGARSSVN